MLRPAASTDVTGRVLPHRDGWSSRLAVAELAQHVLQDAAVSIVVELDRRIDPGHHLEALRLAVLAARDDLERLADREVAGDAADVVRLLTRQAERLHVLPLEELQRQHAHADQVAAVDALERARDHRLDAEHEGALRRPVARRARA